MSGIPDSPFLIVGNDDFVEAVNDVLEMINSYPVGRTVLGEVRKLGRIEIVPFEKGFNAETSYNQGIVAVMAGIKISFSPLTFTWRLTILGRTFADPRVQWPGMKVDEVLLHELVHAVNGLGPGMDLRKAKGTLAKFGIYDDFYAIMVTNIYESEKGNPPSLLRNTHYFSSRGMSELEAVSEIFLFSDGHFPWVKQFCDQNSHFAHLLARSHAKFNPLRVYFLLMNQPDTFEWPAPDLDQLPVKEDVYVPVRQVAHETRPPLSDAVWLEILDQRFRADDVKGYGARARRLVELAASANAAESLPMFSRLLLRAPGDRVAKLFHDNLSTPLRKRVLDQLRRNLAKGYALMAASAHSRAPGI